MSHSHPPPSSQGSTKPKQDLVQIDNSGLEAKVDIENSVSASGEHRIYVSWEGPDDPANPRNWDARKKWLLSSVGWAFHSFSPGLYDIAMI